MTKRQKYEKTTWPKDKLTKGGKDRKTKLKKRQTIKNTETRRKDKKTTYCDDRAVSHTGNVCFSLAHFMAGKFY